MAVTIRRLEKKDVATINRIYQSITSRPADDLFEQIAVEQSPANNNACLVADVDGKVIGFIISYLLRGGFGMNRSAWIMTLGVDPSHMGEGIGVKLAQEVMNFYQREGIDNIYTSVPWDSTDLLSFFKTMGFERSNFINLRKVLE
jgi:ribosomal protein S18 acetylase RimI-like enzyme